MPGKQVRFASISTAYSPSVPSLSYIVPSTSSSSDSGAPRSHSSGLPSAHHGYPHPTLKQSQFYPLAFRVHHLVAYSHHPAINYDVSVPISNMTTSLSGLSTISFSEPAVYPPLSFLEIRIPRHIWPISVHASYNGHYVTVYDVFSAVYCFLRTNVSSSEYRSIPSKKDAEKVRMAYEMRYMRLRDRYAYEAEKQQGVKRVDFLIGHTRFMGLTTSSHGSGVWVLQLS